MEEKTIIAYEGKYFTVTLQSMIGSTNYGWCLASLPDGIVLSGIQNVPVRSGVAPVDQTFYFGVTKVAGDLDVVINFKLCFLSDFTQIGNEVNIKVRLVPANAGANADAESFVQYSDNSAIYNTQPPYGFVLSQADLMYGYPCNVKYGYPSCDAGPVVKYGYPGCDGGPVVKYGYPGCDGGPVVKYGYPGCEDHPVLKYGYPCGAQAVLKYGFPCGSDIVMKYGYPCFEDPTLKYGYPCGIESGFPPVLKYGYPTCQ